MPKYEVIKVGKTMTIEDLKKKQPRDVRSALETRSWLSSSTK